MRAKAKGSGGIKMNQEGSASRATFGIAVVMVSAVLTLVTWIGALVAGAVWLL
jgi:hypothetical protein